MVGFSSSSLRLLQSPLHHHHHRLKAFLPCHNHYHHVHRYYKALLKIYHHNQGDFESHSMFEIMLYIKVFSLNIKKINDDQYVDYSCSWCK